MNKQYMSFSYCSVSTPRKLFPELSYTVTLLGYDDCGTKKEIHTSVFELKLIYLETCNCIADFDTRYI